MNVEIKSRENPEYKELKNISNSKSNLIFIEGKKLFEEAVKSNLTIEKIFIDNSNASLLDDIDCKNSKIVYMGNELLASLFTTKHKPDRNDLIIALVSRPVYSISDVLKSKKHIVFLENVQDPGNLGTVIRSSLAFNAGGVVLSKGSVDCFNTKVIRGSAGSIFRMPILCLQDTEEFLLNAKKQGYKIIAMVTESSLQIDNTELKLPSVLLFGNEGQGLSKEVLNFADEKIAIPMSSGTESLNLASSVNVVLWEQFRKNLNK